MPTTTEGKAHGIHDTIPPNPGEDPEGFQRTTDEFTAQLRPRSLLERHYVEKIAAASWRLRRLHHRQAQTFEDDTLTEDERLNKLDRTLRHETNLNRQVDTAVKMLTSDVPRLNASIAHADPMPECQNELPGRDAATPSPTLSDSPRSGGRGVTAIQTGKSGRDAGVPSSAQPPASQGGSPFRSLTLSAKGRLIPARTDAARRLLDAA